MEPTEVEKVKERPYITWTFQVLMVLLALWLFALGFSLINSKAFFPLRKIPTDSTVTVKYQKDSSAIFVKASTETKKDYTTKNVGMDCPTCTKEYYDLAYNYFILGAGILTIAFFLPRVQSFTFKDVSVTVKEAVESRVREEKNKLIDVVNTSLAANVGSGGKRLNIKDGTTNDRAGKIRKKSKKNFVEDDPQKNQWGGSSTSNGRILKASVTPYDVSDLYDILLSVESLDPSNPLQGKVTFHLHDTFINPNPTIIVKNGKARLKLKAWGAFTVGAEVDDGITRLELDLASNEVKAHQSFKDE